MAIAFKCFATGWAIFVARRMLYNRKDDREIQWALRRNPHLKDFYREWYREDGTIRPFYRILLCAGTATFIAVVWVIIPKTIPF